jgi:general secretion pathway protein A
VLIVDEAQNLSPGILEQVRLLTNLETPKQKLLQIILIGQPELRTLLANADMRQLAQRVTGRYHLEPLGPEDTAKYLEHRLKVAGGSGGIFAPAAVREIYRHSKGVPRLINIVADRTLLAAYTQDTRSIDRRLVRRAAAEVYGELFHARRQLRVAAVLAAVGVAALAFGAWRYTTSSAPVQAFEQTALNVAEIVHEPQAAMVIEPDAARAAELPTLADILGDPLIPKDTDSAFAALFGLWGVTYAQTGAPACEQAQQYHLRCWFQRGTLSHLRRLNRPAILSLIDAHGDDYQLVLSALGETTATLRAGERKYSVELAELAEYWYGDHLILWQPGNGSGGTITPGSQGDAVIWLRESLAKISGEAPPTALSDVYDGALAERVRDYQRERRLVVDGVVGTQTQIVMNTELGVPGTPLLFEAP